ncbi:MAG: carboxylating nicotinate-nucleotide diphosphorylase [Polyangiaceae bacterium]
MSNTAITSSGEELSRVVVERLVRAALEEDLAGGDLTTEACIEAEARAVAFGVARTTLVFAGSSVAEAAFRLVSPETIFEAHVSDGDEVQAGTKLFTVRGSARALLMAERTALNFIQRMSGIATLSRRYVSKVPAGKKTRIADTRKTTPGLRVLERYSVRKGGASNHRDNLGSAVLIKDNHIKAAGSITNAISRAKVRSPHTSRIECEVTNQTELAEALAAGADIIMLDNMTNDEVALSIALNEGRAILEASGGITLERITELANLGIDVISVGALTHSAPSADIALDFE